MIVIFSRKLISSHVKIDDYDPEGYDARIDTSLHTETVCQFRSN